MDCVFGVISTKECSDGPGGVLLCCEGVSGSDGVAPPLNGVLSHKLNACHDITGHELHEIVEEWLAPVLTIELAS